MSSESTSAEDIFDVEKILNDRLVKGKRQYLIKWVGYPDSENTWEEEENLMCEEMLESYKKEKISKAAKKDTHIKKDIKQETAVVKEISAAKAVDPKVKAPETEKKVPGGQEGKIAPVITNEWHDKIHKVVGAFLNSYGMIEIEYVLKNGQCASSLSDILKYKAPLKLLEFYEENLSFPE